MSELIVGKIELNSRVSPATEVELAWQARYNRAFDAYKKRAETLRAIRVLIQGREFSKLSRLNEQIIALINSVEPPPVCGPTR